VSTAHKRDKHGFRGRPGPAQFDLYALPDTALLTEFEVAQIGRWSTNTLQAWRRQPDHALKWVAIAGGLVRYQVGTIKRYLGMGVPRKRKPKPSPAPAATKTAEHSQDSAPPRRRAARPRAAGGLAVAPADDTGVAHG